ncbi:CHAT domain-containing protein [Xylogone sp. PMI_703]|nr:CHAT domain-containing protein [Xylogone sp. PMI_703]
MSKRQQVALWGFIALCELCYVFDFLARLFESKPRPLSERWVLLPSLYGDLTNRQIFFLEWSAKSRYFGDYILSREIFERFLPQPSAFPILAFERSTLYEMEGFDALAAACLKEAIEAHQSLGWEISSPVFRLMKIRRASTELLAYGNLPQALDEARKLRPWLESQNLNSYSDVTTQCYSHYQDIIKVARLHSNWLDLSVDGNVPQTQDNSPSASMAVVRRSLQMQQKGHECQLLVKQEEGLHDDDNDGSAVLPYQEFLECEWAKSNSEVVVNRISFLRVFHAQRLIQLGRKEHATAELERAENSLRQIGGKDISKYNRRLHLLIEITRARINVLDDPIAMVEQHLDLATKAAAFGDRPIQRPELLLAFRKADALVDHKPKGVGSLEVYELRQRAVIANLEFESEQTDSAYFIVPSLATIGLFAASNGLAVSWLQLYNLFRNTYPNHEIPLHSAHLTHRALDAARSLQDESLVSELKRLYMHHLANCPIIKTIRPDGSLEPYVEVIDTDYFYEWNAEFWPELEHLTFFEKTEFISASILLRFIRRETSQAFIDRALAQQITKWNHSEDLNFSQWLERADPESLRLAIYGTPKSPTDPAEWDRWFAVVELWLRRSDLPPSVLHRQNLLKEISNARQISWTNSVVDFPAPVSYHQRDHYEKTKSLQILTSIDQRIVRDAEIRTRKLDIASSVIRMALNSPAREARVITDSDLAVTQDLLEQLAHEHRGLGSPRWLLTTLSKLKTIAWIRSFIFQSLPSTGALKYLDEADEIIRQMLSQSQYLPVFQSYAIELAAADDMNIDDYYRFGVLVSFSAFQRWCAEHVDELSANLHAPLPEDGEKLLHYLIMWTQRAKARATTHILGFNFTAPLGSSAESPESHNLLLREEKLLEELNTDRTVVGILRKRKEWQDLRQEMLRDENLKYLVAVQQGYSITIPELSSMFQWFKEDATFVDFVEVNYAEGEDLLMIIYRNGKCVACQPLGIKLREVENWIASNLELDLRIYDLEDDAKFCPLSGDQATRQLNKLAGLIKPLEQWTSPGEVIVLCPVKALHRIPLHALPIGDQILIERNPVVYCQSFTLLRLCFINRFKNNWSSISRPVVYSPLSNELPTAAAVVEIAEVLGTVVEGRDASKTPKEDFVSRITEAPLIHVHGHVRFDDTEPLKHHLELAATQVDEGKSPIPLSDDEILTAKDAFSLRIIPGSHVTTVSCKSARVRITEGNDLVGLGTAFHCASAGSMISTLWNIWREDGTRFSKDFYTDLFEQCRTRDSNDELPEIVDMARAMQHAVLKLRKSPDGKIRAPYHWAGFVFNGAWQIQNIALNAANDDKD